MAVRRPLVLVDGKLTELPSADTLPGTGGASDYTVVTTGQTLADDAPLLAQLTAPATFTVPASPEVGDEYVVKNASVSTALASIDPGAGRQIVYGNGQALPVADPLTLAPGEQGVLIVRTATSFELQVPGAVGPTGPTGAGFDYVQASEPVGALDGETWMDTDLDPLARANHTGEQAISTVTGLAAALASAGIPEAPEDGTDYARRDAGWVAVPRFLTLVKTADESRSNNTLADDAELQSALEANSVYRIELLLRFRGGVAEDFRFRLERTGLSDADLRYAGDLDNASSPTLTWGTTTNCAVAAAATNYIGNYIGTLVTGANAGTIRLQWAQQVTGATAAILAVGSMLMLRKVA